MYVHGGTLSTGLANVRADLPDILHTVQSGALKPELVTTQRAEWSDATEVLLMSATKVILVCPSLFTKKVTN